MAIINCPDCSHNVSPEAAQCPNCGRPIHIPAWRDSKVVLPVLGMAVTGVGAIFSALMVLSLFLPWLDIGVASCSYLSWMSDSVGKPGDILFIVPVLPIYLAWIGVLGHKFDTAPSDRREQAGCRAINWILAGALGLGVCWWMRHPDVNGMSLERVLGSGYSLYWWCSLVLLISGILGLLIALFRLARNGGDLRGGT